MLSAEAFGLLWKQIREIIIPLHVANADRLTIKQAVRAVLNERSDLDNMYVHIVAGPIPLRVYAILYDISDQHSDMWRYVWALYPELIGEPTIAPRIIELVAEAIRQEFDVTTVPDIPQTAVVRNAITHVLRDDPAIAAWFATNFPET
jgi:hypothetical protein